MSLESLMSSFLHPHSEETYEQLDIEQNLTLPPAIKEPLDYWVAKLELWQQLALEFALEKLSCPASSVASERVFSVAGAIVTPRCQDE